MSYIRLRPGCQGESLTVSELFVSISSFLSALLKRKSFVCSKRK